jgi:GNAT superfamily N-acetyltransferase
MIKQFNNANLEPLYELIQDTIEYSYRDIYPDRALHFFKDYHSKSSILERSRNGVVLLLEKEGTFVATGSLVANEISGVFVAPKSQGYGYGTTIMQDLESRAQINDFSEIILDISLPSRRLYEKLHYQISEECIFDVGMGEILKYWKGVKIISV